MNTLLSDKLNSQIEVYWKVVEGQEPNTLVVRNIGGVDSTLSRLWVVTNDGHASLFCSSDSIPSGNFVELPLNVLPPQFAKDNVKTYKVLTTLGNMASPQGQTTIIGLPGGGNGNAAIGSIIVADYSSFKHFTFSGSTINNPNGGLDGYSVSINAKDKIAFKVTLTNMDSQGRQVTVTSGSQMFFLGTKNQGQGYIVSYLRLPSVKVDLSTGAITPFTPVTIESGKSATFYFASEDSLGNSADSGIYPLNLALVGTIGGASLGQNIPFVTISLTVTKN